MRVIHGGTASASEALIVRAADEVDQSLLDWFGGLTMIERLRAASHWTSVLYRISPGAFSSDDT